MNEVDFDLLIDATIPGEPIPKGRPRTTASGRTYTPRRTEDAETALSWDLKIARKRQCIDGSVSVEMHFHCASPHPADLDNLVKLVLDAANHILWTDDQQVTHIAASVERGADEPRTEIKAWMA